MLTVPGIDPKRIVCDDLDDVKRIILDYRTIARLSESGVSFDGDWNGQLGIDACAVLKVVVAEWLASDGTRLWPEPPPDLLEVAKEVLRTCMLPPDDRFRLNAAVAAEETKRATAKEAK